MIFINWVNKEDLTISDTATLFGLSRSSVYDYLYGEVIPKKLLMQKIFITTGGQVDANDFNGTTREFLEKSLLELKLTEKIKKRW